MVVCLFVTGVVYEGVQEHILCDCLLLPVSLWRHALLVHCLCTVCFYLTLPSQQVYMCRAHSRASGDLVRGYATHAGPLCLCHQLRVTAGWPEQHTPVNGSCCHLSLACRVPFVQRILHERRAASQSAQPGTDATPSKHVSLSHHLSPVPSPRSPSRASLVPPSGFTTPGRLSRSPSMCPTPKSPGHRLSVLLTSTSRCDLCDDCQHIRPYVYHTFRQRYKCYMLLNVTDAHKLRSREHHAAVSACFKIIN